MSRSSPGIEPDWHSLLQSLPGWVDLYPEIRTSLSASRHGDFPRWQHAVAVLPHIEVEQVSLGPTVTLRGRAAANTRRSLSAALEALQPWRKGPFDLFGVLIDSEWRSDWKWQRIVPHVGSLTGQRVLDVGCGNGYFGWRMIESGARLVVGVDPMVLFCLQHLAVNFYLRDSRSWVLPLSFEVLPPAHFDTVFSLGVIYHRRDPEAHARRLLAFTRPGGRVVVESLVVTHGPDLVPAGRYARMRNVWVVPRPDTLCAWLTAAGFENARLADVTTTSTDEQRTTRWMAFESLEHALDPADPSRTVEGHPAPVRAVVVAERPDKMEMAEENA